MVFCPSSRESCEYYGVDFESKQKFVGQDHDAWVERTIHSSLMPKPTSAVDYYPQQSRDYALSNTIRCACSACPANKNNYCETPALIEITAGGRCKTALLFLKEETQRDSETFAVKKDAHTPDWFFNRWCVNCPICTVDELAELRRTNTNPKWIEDVFRVNLERK